MSVEAIRICLTAFDKHLTFQPANLTLTLSIKNLKLVLDFLPCTNGTPRSTVELLRIHAKWSFSNKEY